MEQVKKNIDENKKNNITLKKHLMEICSEIEKVFEERKKKKINRNNPNENSIKIDIKEYSKFQSEIGKYKKKIEQKKKEIINTSDYNKIVTSENDYKYKYSKLLDLQQENELLSKMNNELAKQINDDKGGDKIKIRNDQIQEKLDNLKKTIEKLNKEIKKITKNIRNQKNQINELDQFTKKVQYNIEYEKSEREAENSNDDIEKKTNGELTKEIMQLKNTIDEIEKKKLNQEKINNESIKNQNKNIQNIQKEIEGIKIKIKLMNNDNRIKEHKIQEYKKIIELEKAQRLNQENNDKIQEEKKRKEMIRKKNFLEFHKKFFGSKGIGGDILESPTKKIYQKTTTNKDLSDNNNGNMWRYSNNKAPFHIKFNSKSQKRALTQGLNDYDLNNETDINNIEQPLIKSNNQNYLNTKKTNNETVADEIDNLKNDIMSALSNQDNNYNNEIKSSEDNIKIGGNRSPFQIKPFSSKK